MGTNYDNSTTMLILLKNFDVTTHTSGISHISRSKIALIRNTASSIHFTFARHTNNISRSTCSSLGLNSRINSSPFTIRRGHHHTLRTVNTTRYRRGLLIPGRIRNSRVITIASGNTSSLRSIHRRVTRNYSTVIYATRGMPILLYFTSYIPIILITPDKFTIIRSN